MNRKTLAIVPLALCFGIFGAFGTLGTVATAHAAAAQADNLWIHIHVKSAAEGNVSINLPVSVIEKMAHVLPAEAQADARLRFEEEDVSVADLRKIWQELRHQPDATFITVDETDSKVRVAKRGNNLIVRAHERSAGRDEQVEMKIPGTVVEALLSAEGEQLNVGAALQALARHGEGELVTVTGAGETVRIWIDNRSDSRTSR